MVHYLGISMIVIVTSLCIGILSTIVSENIFKQMEAHRKRVASDRAKLIIDAIKGSTEYVGKYINYVKEAKEMDDELGKDGNEIAKYAAKKAVKDFKEKEIDSKK